MSLSDELSSLDATAQAELVAKREVQPIELVDSAVERIEKLNPVLNAVVTPIYEQAREAARAELPRGPFTGVPFLIKDMLASYAGVRMTMGTRLLENYVADHDSELVTRFKRAGLIVLGKTNVPEFGILPTTESILLGPCHNPWSPEHTPGGSSGGSAAAVASGMVAMAHANDGGGSIRIPASCCGLFGLKPTRARNPLGPDFGDVMGGLVVEHAVTRSVRDSAALLDATAGPMAGDPYWAPPRERPYLQEVGAPTGKLRIAVSADAGEIPVHEDCKRALAEAAALCSELGHEVREAAPSIDREAMTNAFSAVYTASIAFELKSIGATAEVVEPLSWRMYELASAYDAADYLIAISTIQRIARDIAGFMADYDLLLTPTLNAPPLPLGSYGSPQDDPLTGILQALYTSAFTNLYNATGQPAMSVPLFWNDQGLPVGVHFVGRFGDEATLFRLAAQLEQARPWAGRRPAVRA